MCAQGKRNILYFDGVCALCNFWVDILIKFDKNQRLQFAPLQGPTAANSIDQKHIENLTTLVFIKGEETFTKSDAVIYSLASIGGIFKLIYIFKLIPKFIRDKIYTSISNHRYKWFGKKEACRLPTEEERGRLLP